jgi:YidC/Oxa1 family membrane protein insertase
VGAIYHFLETVMGVAVLFFYHLTNSYGAAIILVTLAVRLVLTPVTVRQFESMRQMQAVQPELKKLQERYKNDPQKLNQATAELFREHGVNPMAGCLPTLLQLPFLWGLYGELRSLNYHRAGFFWIPNLGQYDPYYVLPLLSGLMTLVSTRLSMPVTGQAQDRTQQLLTMVLMPAVIVYITLHLPAGVALYWTVSQLISVAQQYVFWVRRPPSAGEVARGRGPRAKVEHAR